ncbi:MAG TPA: hypothetical protein VFA26_14505 [Gemmataceae bacterium]|nr:hypothetical protein [Gemmataceae bacterium]
MRLGGAAGRLGQLAGPFQAVHGGPAARRATPPHGEARRLPAWIRAGPLRPQPRASHREGPAIASDPRLPRRLWVAPQFFLTAYLPGYLIGLGLCWLHGHYEHCRGTVSHHGLLYNLLFFNDGYHVEHHAAPGAHWTCLPLRTATDTPTSRWPAVLRWLDAFSLEGLERRALRSPRLQRFLLRTHERAFRALLPRLPEVRRVAIVGGGLFPRTLLVLRRLLPEARFVIIDRSAANLDAARPLFSGEVEIVHAAYAAHQLAGCDLAVFPLAFAGDREALYREPPAPAVIVHDWMWRRRGSGARVSLFLLKRLNLVTR